VSAKVGGRKVTYSWTVLRAALVGAVLAGALSAFGLEVGNEAPRLLGKLLGSGVGGAIFGAVLAKMFLPTTQTPVNHSGDIIAVSVAFAGIFLACLAQVNFVLNEHVGLKDNARTAFLAGAAEPCVTRQSAAPENAGVDASAIAAYCDCSANGIADRVSFNQLKGYVSAGALPGALLEAVAGTCRAQEVK
jgi:hypothetical protein